LVTVHDAVSGCPEYAVSGASTAVTRSPRRAARARRAPRRRCPRACPRTRGRPGRPRRSGSTGRPARWEWRSRRGLVSRPTSSGPRAITRASSRSSRLSVGSTDR
jgi:hypothetical protein